MVDKPTYEELEERVKELEEEVLQQKRTEESLKESESRFRQLAENINEVFYINDPKKTQMIYVSPAYEEIWGRTCESLYDQPTSFVDAIAPEDRDRVIATFVKQRQGKSIDVRYRVVRSDGSLRWIRSRAYPVFDEDGDLCRIVGIAEDITEIKRAEEALKKSEEKYKTLVEQSIQGTVVIQDNRIVFANKSFADISGYSSEELLSLSPEKVMEMVHPDDRDLVWGRLRNRLEGKPTPSQYEFRGIRKDGSVRWLQMHAKLVKYNGRPAVQSTTLDFTDRRLAEDALRESEERFRELCELLPETVYEMDTRGNLTFVNQKAFDDFRYTQEDFDRGLNAFDMIAPDDRARALENVKKILGGQILGLSEYTAVRKDGTTFPAMIGSTAILRKGKPIGLRGFIIDISAQKRVEEELKAREKELQVKTSNLEEANIALEVLLNKTDEDIKELEKKILLNMKWLVLPYLEKMKKSGLNKRQETYRNIVESFLKEITSSFALKMSSQELNLTPTEIRVASFVKGGKTTKEIAELLNSSVRAVEFHRENLRAKFDLKNKKINLRSYLLSIS